MPRTPEEIYVYEGPKPEDVAKLDLAASEYLKLANKILAALPDNEWRDGCLARLEASFHLSVKSVLQHVEPPEPTPLPEGPDPNG
jgi:hypothetical protein